MVGQHIVFVLLDLLARTLKTHDLKRRAAVLWRRIKGSKKNAVNGSDVKRLIQTAVAESEAVVEEPQAKRLKIDIPVPGKPVVESEAVVEEPQAKRPKMDNPVP